MVNSNIQKYYLIIRVDDPQNVGTFSSWSHGQNKYRFMIIFADLVEEVP